MAMRRTYIDAGVLIAAARGTGALASAALRVLDDPDREYVASVFLRLELLPKPTCYGRTAEVEFYEEFFASVTSWATDVAGVTEQALQEACTHGLAAMDALHVAAAVALGAEELITTERPEKPIHRVTRIKVTPLYPDTEADVTGQPPTAPTSSPAPARRR